MEFIILLDISVLAHVIAYRFQTQYKRKRHLLDAYGYACINRIAAGLTMLDTQGSPARIVGVIGCLDMKIPGLGYWRHQYLADNYGIKYKTGRKPSYVDELALTRRGLIEACNRVGSTLGFIGYEADDVASYLSQVLYSNYPKYKVAFLTVDSDWLGLLQPDKSVWVGVANSRCHWVSRVEHLAHKLGEKTPYNTFREVWERKAKVGDNADSLPTNSPIEVIDLLEPPNEFNLLQQHGTHWAEHVINKAIINNSDVDLFTSSQFFEKQRLWAAPESRTATNDCPLLGYQQP